MAQHQHSPSFDVRDATIESVQEAIVSGSTTCRTVVEAFISRIEKFNPQINAILSLNPDALLIADSLDQSLANGESRGRLFGIPVLLKDNFDAIPMATTAGCLALKNLMPLADAPTVAALRDAGAIILGKTNLHELALEGLTVSSYGGQTINPYDFTRTPGGSSGGTGAAIASSFAVLGTGTDTMNSLRSPASANSLFSIRPTRGLISRSGVVPVSQTQDAVGPIGRCVNDIAVALTVMASVGYDPKDESTALRPAFVEHIDYLAEMQGGSVFEIRLGLIEGFFNRTESDETSPVNEAMAGVVSDLKAAGATIIKITDPIFNSPSLHAAHDVQRFEFAEELTFYLQRPSLIGDRPSTIRDLYFPVTDNAGASVDTDADAGNTRDNFLVIPAQHAQIHSALSSSTTSPEYASRKASIASLNEHLESIFQTHNLTALIYPEQANLVVKLGSPSQSGRNGILAAVTGSPVVTVPIGFSHPTVDAPLGVPIGMEMLGRPWSEVELLRLAKLVDEALSGGKPRRRFLPKFCDEPPGSTQSNRNYDTVPVIVPQSGNVDTRAYPLGTLGEKKI